MPLYVDNRRGSKSLVNISPLNDPTKPYHAQLYDFETDSIPGDIYFYGNGPNDDTLQIGIEVKRLDNDFIESLDSGRLTGEHSGQIPRMLDWFDVTYLIYYGIYRMSQRQTSPTTQ